MKKIAFILAGGRGTRLWPLSRENYPKQFVPFKDGLSLFQMALERTARVFYPEDIYIVSSENYRFTILNQIEMFNGIRKSARDKIKENIIFEPAPKSTLPAIFLSMKYAELRRALSDDDMIYVFPSDHIIEPLSKFKTSVEKAARLASDGKIVVFGVKPSCPKEGYGYIIRSKKYKSGFLIDRFVEKPRKAQAEKLIQKGALWNAGIFCFTKGAFLRELGKFQPVMAKYSNCSYNALIRSFKAIKPISIDYGIMQKTKDAGVVKFNPKWSDLGSWDSFLQYFTTLEMKCPKARQSPKGGLSLAGFTHKNGNFNIGKAEFLESKGSFTYSAHRLMCLVGIDNVIAIDSPDSLLLMKKGCSDRVKELVSIIDKKGYGHSKDGMTVHRPWGYYTILHESRGYKVKEIGVYPKKTIVLQSHKYRSEHWNIVEGAVRVSVAGKSRYAKLNESIYVPKGIKHTIYNPTDKLTKIIEVQIGSYLDEDDITRFAEYRNGRIR